MCCNELRDHLTEHIKKAQMERGQPRITYDKVITHEIGIWEARSLKTRVEILGDGMGLDSMGGLTQTLMRCYIRKCWRDRKDAEYMILRPLNQKDIRGGVHQKWGMEAARQRRAWERQMQVAGVRDLIRHILIPVRGSLELWALLEFDTQLSTMEIWSVAKD